MLSLNKPMGSGRVHVKMDRLTLYATAWSLEPTIEALADMCRMCWAHAEMFDRNPHQRFHEHDATGAELAEGARLIARDMVASLSLRIATGPRDVAIKSLVLSELAKVPFDHESHAIALLKASIASDERRAGRVLTTTTLTRQ